MRGIARHVQVGGDSRGPRLFAALSDCRGADRRGRPLEQAARVGPDGLRTHLCQGEHGRRRVRHDGQSKVCFSGATEKSEQSLRKKEQSSFCCGNPQSFRRVWCLQPTKGSARGLFCLVHLMSCGWHDIGCTKDRHTYRMLNHNTSIFGPCLCRQNLW